MPMPNRKITGEPYRYGYQGQELDPETGKEAFQLRLWDARIGRWLTTDPYGQFHSPYLGMGNNPITMVDPDGGSTCPDPPCGGGVVDGGELDTVYLTGNGGSSGFNTWTSEVVDRYAFSGSFGQWHQQFGSAFSNIPSLAYDQWDVSYGTEHTAFADRMDRARNAEKTMAHLEVWLTFFHEAEELAYVLPGSALGSLARSSGRVFSYAPRFANTANSASTFFEGTNYTSKVFRQMSNVKDSFHGFPSSVEGYATKFGRSSTKIGGDGKVYQWLELQGGFRGRTGNFEFIKDANGVINHRFFNAR
jgi:RHS repeat-associated protein